MNQSLRAQIEAALVTARKYVKRCIEQHDEGYAGHLEEIDSVLSLLRSVKEEPPDPLNGGFTVSEEQFVQIERDLRTPEEPSELIKQGEELLRKLYPRSLKDEPSEGEIEAACGAYIITYEVLSPEIQKDMRERMRAALIAATAARNAGQP